ncbi:MAG: fused DSP-PTPase phosphatase/NAD kinase-like protein [Acidimicrobiales bacterium]
MTHTLAADLVGHPDHPEDPPSPARSRGWGRRLLRLIVGFVAVLVIGNIGILVAHAYARSNAPIAANAVTADVAAIRNFEVVDATLWRGGAPTDAEYRSLAEAGVTTVVDLRAEHGVHVPDDLLAELGIRHVSIPIRDGQTPTPVQVQRFLDAVDASTGRVYLHCGAGVGRTGTMAAVYSVSHGATGWDAMRANLAVGPPSLEQLAFAASLDVGEPASRPNPAIVAVSRTLDAPRRLWKVVEGL